MSYTEFYCERCKRVVRVREPDGTWIHKYVDEKLDTMRGIKKVTN